jgi:4'-phosphopantetheinyl transferase
MTVWGSTLDSSEVQLWAIPLEDPPLPMRAFKGLLSRDELARAHRLRYHDDQQRAVVGRGALRLILGTLLQVDPTELVFAAQERGKPVLQAEGEYEIDFNVSHSGGWILIGISKRGCVGVDIEQVRPVPNFDRLASRYFTSGEHSVITSLPESDRLPAFFRCWTRKEAVMKATGSGINGGLNTFEVSVRPGEPPALLTPGVSSDLKGPWTIWAGIPAAGYLAALAVKGREIPIVPRYWRSSGIYRW